MSGCASSYRVRVNGYLDTSLERAAISPQSSFCVIENRSASNPIFESQIRSKIEQLLARKGFAIKPCDSADFHMGFTYALGAGQAVTDVRREYTLGETGTVITHGPDGEVHTSTVLMPARTTYVPYQYTEHTAMLTLEVTDAAGVRVGKEGKKVWIGESSMTVRDPDRRDIVNYLLAAVFDHFAENTPKSIIAVIPENAPRVEAIR
ncbi:MAG TPA: DUF4136 domain-containing protein [Candidatus Omnitrophota bacterium]|nr:DUF4136 domain-containing protein [Candidatus Omnitrophota bacterium]